MEKIEFTAQEIPCSTRPLIYDDSTVHRLQPLRVRVPVRYPASLAGKGEASHCDVSGGVLLLRRLRHGLPKARRPEAFASADEPGEIRSGEKRRDVI